MRTTEHCFCVAGFRLHIHVPEVWKMERMLPSFLPFRDKGAEGDVDLLDCEAFSISASHPVEMSGTLLEETCNDMGYIRLFAQADRYEVSLSREPGGRLHFMQANRDFSQIRILLCEEDNEAGRMLSSLLRIAYSQAILYHQAVAIHASAVYRDGKAYLFMGKSGTGKSTHSTLWMKHIRGTELLNDDNPTIRIMNDKAYACGTPWSGKTPCYKPLTFPIGGMVRLSQASENRFIRQEGAEAFVALYPGCSAICQDVELRNRLYDTLAQVAEAVPVGRLDCMPDEEAAYLCWNELSKSN